MVSRIKPDIVYVRYDLVETQILEKNAPRFLALILVLGTMLSAQNDFVTVYKTTGNS
jgi:hypothetical protein